MATNKVMTTLTKRSLKAMASVIYIAALTACDVHEFPSDEPKGGNEEPVPFVLHLDFETEMPLYTTINYSRTTDVADMDIRYIIKIYNAGRDGNSGRQADETLTFIRPAKDGLDYSVTIDLEPGTYDFKVWTDYIDTGSEADKYYNTSDFAEIMLASREPHIGCDDFRDAFRGFTSAQVIHGSDSQTGNQAYITMVRPMAKYKFITTDLKEFEAYALQHYQQKHHAPESDDDGSRAINPEDYSIIIRYNGFMPCSFNMFTDKPADAWTGVFYAGTIKSLGTEDAELGFDYVFVNGSETTVTTIIEVYDPDGDLLARTGSIEIPLVRSRLTVVKGDFMTSLSQGSVGIDPDFDGEYNIEIQL